MNLTRAITEMAKWDVVSLHLLLSQAGISVALAGAGRRDDGFCCW